MLAFFQHMFKNKVTSPGPYCTLYEFSAWEQEGIKTVRISEEFLKEENKGKKKREVHQGRLQQKLGRVKQRKDFKPMKVNRGRSVSKQTNHSLVVEDWQLRTNRRAHMHLVLYITSASCQGVTSVLEVSRAFWWWAWIRQSLVNHMMMWFTYGVRTLDLRATFQFNYSWKEASLHTPKAHRDPTQHNADGNNWGIHIKT